MEEEEKYHFEITHSKIRPYSVRKINRIKIKVIWILGTLVVCCFVVYDLCFIYFINFLCLKKYSTFRWFLLLFEFRIEHFSKNPTKLHFFPVILTLFYV